MISEYAHPILVVVRVDDDGIEHTQYKDMGSVTVTRVTPMGRFAASGEAGPRNTDEQ